jgi:hypothetical protein
LNLEVDDEEKLMVPPAFSKIDGNVSKAWSRVVVFLRYKTPDSLVRDSNP